LPPAELGAGRPLPLWARALAGSLPHTTAAMLELDYLHRARSPLGPTLRGQMRWVAARANGCRYAEAEAEADLHRAGVGDDEIRRLDGDLSSLPGDVRAALEFARKLSRDGASVTDEEVARLVALHGERQVVAMALLVAYASFQDRLLLALDLGPEPDGALPPLAVRFVRPPLGTSRAAARDGPQGGPVLVAPEDDPEWPKLDFGAVREKLADQRGRRCRIPLPPAEPDVNRWGLVCKHYQPELSDAWGACARAFGDEANQDPVFEQCLFWVVTRTTRCFY
jgi:alkylhydroperoxidase family enzyme